MKPDKMYLNRKRGKNIKRSLSLIRYKQYTQECILLASKLCKLPTLEGEQIKKPSY
jgi:hypothetical protein